MPPRPPVLSLLGLPHGWTRRVWLQTTVAQTGALIAFRPGFARGTCQSGECARLAAGTASGHGAPPEQLAQWAQRAVEAAQAAGASYADARFTRTTQQSYSPLGGGVLEPNEDTELVGVGVRAVVNGYWGFAACPLWVSASTGAETVVRLARTAVAQAQVNARGIPSTVEMGHVPAVTGTWATPFKLDPFAISIEEKVEVIRYWNHLANRFGLGTEGPAWLRFVRQERVLVTSDGSLVHQTCYESGGECHIKFEGDSKVGNEYPNAILPLLGLDVVGKGWEVILEAKVPEQLATMPDKLKAIGEIMKRVKPRRIGRYTVVCDGATMASLLDQTLGVATQLDRALGYEANMGGTTYLDDPLAMVGHYAVASPLVTVTANRSAPGQLATVQWDDEGIVPEDFTLVKDGVLVDFQTTREQSAWLAPYYQQTGQPVRSHGCAAAEDATTITMQHMPNLALSPSSSEIHLEDLVADVKDGILIEGGVVAQADFQGRTGLLDGRMREITNGRLGPPIAGGSIMFDAVDFWKHVTAVGGPATELGLTPMYDYTYKMRLTFETLMNQLYPNYFKGQPAQRTHHSVRAVAATITNQPLVDPRRRA
ncbi:MAG TPA: metallopeptidase TldD-related protein [Gemmatimonadaceae bacterium]|nr:metallopeptidase TldD-related protein [Gemmatimonadaceae bacterium]